MDKQERNTTPRAALILIIVMATLCAVAGIFGIFTGDFYLTIFGILGLIAIFFTVQ